MIKTRSRKARIAAAAVGVAAIAASSVFGLATSASAASTDTAVTKLSVKKGSTAGGTPVTITGKNFTGTIVAADVLFGAVAATSIIVLSPTQIVAVAPAGAAGLVQVEVTANSIASADVTADDYTYVAPITSTVAVGTLLNPAAKSVISVTSSVSLGADATAFKALKVTAKVGGVVAPVTWFSEFVAKVTAPIGAASATEVEVLLNIDGVTGTATVANDVKYASVITGLSKTTGKIAGGETVVVTGKGLTGATAWQFGAVAATCAATSVAKVDTSWTCTAPASGGAVAATVQVNFTPAAAPFGTIAGAYTYTDVS